MITNNHPDGKAAVSALEVKHLLTGKKVKGPEMLVAHYLRIAEFVPAVSCDQSGDAAKPLL